MIRILYTGHEEEEWILTTSKVFWDINKKSMFFIIIKWSNQRDNASTSGCFLRRS